MRYLLPLSLFAVSATAFPSPISQRVPSALQKRAVALSWVDKYAAIGDSYAAGIGAGQLGTGQDDGYYSRYQGSYPAVVNSRAGFAAGANFQFLAMSGAESWKIKDEQVSKLDAPKIITLSAGGNDVGLTKVLNHCVYQYAPGFTWVNGQFKNDYKCQDAINEAKTAITAPKFTSDLTELMAAALEKLDAQGTLFWTAYSRFFNAETDRCDGVSWSLYVPAMKTVPELSGFEIAYLTKDVRRGLNELVDLVNEVIRDITTEESRVVFVEYQSQFIANAGLYCEEGVNEPEWMREATMFYEIPQGGEVPTWLYIPGLGPREDPAPREGSVERQIWDAVFQSQVQYDGKLRLDEGIEDAIEKRNPDITFSWDPLDMARTVKDLVFRVFHPTVKAHDIIANTVIAAMQQQYPGGGGGSGQCPVFPIPDSPYNMSPGCNCDDEPRVWESNPKDKTYVPGSVANAKIEEMCKLVSGITMDPTDTDILTNAYLIDGTTSNMLWMDLIWDSDSEDCQKNRVVDEGECVDMLKQTIHGCDTWTTWYKHGGRRMKDCVLYSTRINGDLGVPVQIEVTPPAPDPEKEKCYTEPRPSDLMISFDGASADPRIDEFCGDFERYFPAGSIEFLNVDPTKQYMDSVNFVEIGAIVQEGCNTSDTKNGLVDKCKAGLRQLVANCDYGTTVKWGGTLVHECVKYKINGNKKQTTTPW